MFVAGFSPIPDKVFTITAGVMAMALLPFVIASAIGRSGRFFLVAALMVWGGERHGMAVAAVCGPDRLDSGAARGDGRPVLLSTSEFLCCGSYAGGCIRSRPLARAVSRARGVAAGKPGLGLLAKISSQPWRSTRLNGFRTSLPAGNRLGWRAG